MYRTIRPHGSPPAARRKLIDASRRERTRREKQNLLEQEIAIEAIEVTALPESLEREIPDDRLRLIFTCCHPALNREAQIALTLRTLGGLSTGEIARAFLLPEPTLAQRLVRAKRKIQDAAHSLSRCRPRIPCPSGGPRCRQ